jgi:acyl carrier protein
MVITRGLSFGLPRQVDEFPQAARGDRGVRQAVVYLIVEEKGKTTMIDEQSVTDEILAAIREFNEQGGPDQRLTVTPDTTLFGHGAPLDSLGLVSLILLVEERIAARFAIAVSLADERALSQERSPFRNVKSLADYALRAIRERER